MSAQGWIQRKILANNKNKNVFRWFLLTFFLLQVGKYGFTIYCTNCMWQVLNIIEQNCPFTLSVNIVFTVLYPGGHQRMGYFTGHWPGKREVMEIPCMESHPQPPILCIPLLCYEKDIFVPWGMTILTSRDELLIERRGQWDSWHAADYAEQLKHSYCTCLWRVKEYSLQLGLKGIYKTLYNTSNRPTRGKRRMWAIISSAGHMSFAAHYKSLHAGKLMQHCFVVLPYDTYAAIMRLSSVLIEWDDDIDMK